MRKTPLLDLGNVIVKVDFTPFFSWLSTETGISQMDRLTGLLHSSLFYDLEFGHITWPDFHRRLLQLYGGSYSLARLEEAFCSIFPGLVEGAEEMLHGLKTDGPVYCLSNTNEIHLAHCRATYPVLAEFTKVFASHEIHKRKPYPGTYRDVAASLEVPPSQIVFFDDSHANVQGAIRAGLEAHFFTTTAAATAILKNSKENVDNEDRGEYL